MIYAALIVMLMLVVAPAQAQDPATAYQAAGEAGVAIVALVSIPIAARYVYLIVKTVFEDKKAERAAAGKWFEELAKRHGLLADAVNEGQAGTTAALEAAQEKIEEMRQTVATGATSADSLAGDVRALMERIEPAITAMEAIEQDIRRRDLEDAARNVEQAAQAAESTRIAQALEALTQAFNSLKQKIEEGKTNDAQPSVNPGNNSSGAAADSGSSASLGTWLSAGASAGHAAGL